MLGKLLKYEFRSTARYFLPIYAALLIIAGISAMLNHNIQAVSTGHVVLGGLYGLLAVALSIISVVVIISRFYKNLLGSEGYLMFTLPVTAGQNILGKLIPALCWGIGSILLGLITIIPVSHNSVDIFSYVSSLSLPELNDWQFWLCFAEGIIACILSAAAGILFCYFCMGIGQLFNEHKFIASVVTFLGIRTILQVIGSILLIWAARSDRLQEFLSGLIDPLFVNGMPSYLAPLGMLIPIIFALVVCLLYFFLTRWLLGKKLNLA